MIVEGPYFDARRQGLLDAVYLGVNFVGHLHRVAVGLAVDIQEDGRFAVCIDDRVHGLDAGSNAGNVANAYWNSGLGCLDHRARNLFRRPHLRVDEPQHQLVIAFDQAR